MNLDLSFLISPTFGEKYHFRGTFVEAIDKGFFLWYTRIIIDFCAPSDWDN